MPNLSLSGALAKRICANVRAVFEFSGENAKIADCLAERSHFELSGDFANSLH